MIPCTFKHKTSHAQLLSLTLKKILWRPPVIFHNMSNNKNFQITEYKADNIITNVLRLVAN